LEESLQDSAEARALQHGGGQDRNGHIALLAGQKSEVRIRFRMGVFSCICLRYSIQNTAQFSLNACSRGSLPSRISLGLLGVCCGLLSLGVLASSWRLCSLGLRPPLRLANTASGPAALERGLVSPPLSRLEGKSHVEYRVYRTTLPLQSRLL